MEIIQHFIIARKEKAVYEDHGGNPEDIWITYKPIHPDDKCPMCGQSMRNLAPAPPLASENKLSQD